MKIVKSKDKQWLEKQGYSKKIILDDIDKKRVVVQEVKINAGETARSHYHKIQTEVFYFLTENGYWIINGKKMSFKTGDVLVIEPFDKHEVVNDTSKDYLYLAVKYDYAPDDLYWE